MQASVDIQAESASVERLYNFISEKDTAWKLTAAVFKESFKQIIFASSGFLEVKIFLNLK